MNILLDFLWLALVIEFINPMHKCHKGHLLLSHDQLFTHAVSFLSVVFCSKYSTYQKTAMNRVLRWKGGLA